MGKWKAIIPIFLALIIAGTGSFVVYRWTETKTDPQKMTQVEEHQVETVQVVVAAGDLQWGTKLTKEMIKTVPFLKTSLPHGHYSNATSVLDRVLIAPLQGKDPVTESRLAPKNIKVGGVSAVLQSGKRAVSVKGDKIVGLSGLVKPGNRVDVLVTMKNPKNDKDMTKLVLENIPVLATGTQIENKNDDPSPVDVYTLEVTPEQAEKLALASTKGRLQFALRNIIDSESVKTTGADIAETLKSLSIEKKAPQSKPVARSRHSRRMAVYTIEVINGEDLSKKRF
jgi:pilus assembly protein CpaB